MELKKIVGERIKECRKLKGLTQKQVSLSMGIVPQQYQTYENGRYELSYQQIITLCRILDVSADYLLGLEDESGSKTSSETFEYSDGVHTVKHKRG